MLADVILEWSGGGIVCPPPFLGAEGWRGAEHISWSGLVKGVFTSLLSIPCRRTWLDARGRPKPVFIRVILLGRPKGDAADGK